MQDAVGKVICQCLPQLLYTLRERTKFFKRLFRAFCLRLIQYFRRQISRLADKIKEIAVILQLIKRRHLFYAELSVCVVGNILGVLADIFYRADRLFDFIFALQGDIFIFIAVPSMFFIVVSDVLRILCVLLQQIDDRSDVFIALLFDVLDKIIKLDGIFASAHLLNKPKKRLVYHVDIAVEYVDVIV